MDILSFSHSDKSEIDIAPLPPTEVCQEISEDMKRTLEVLKIQEQIAKTLSEMSYFFGSSSRVCDVQRIHLRVPSDIDINVVGMIKGLEHLFCFLFPVRNVEILPATLGGVRVTFEWVCSDGVVIEAEAYINNLMFNQSIEPATIRCRGGVDIRVPDGDNAILELLTPLLLEIDNPKKLKKVTQRFLDMKAKLILHEAFELLREIEYRNSHETLRINPHRSKQIDTFLEKHGKTILEIFYRIIEGAIYDNSISEESIRNVIVEHFKQLPQSAPIQKTKRKIRNRLLKILILGRGIGGSSFRRR